MNTITKNIRLNPYYNKDLRNNSPIKDVKENSFPNSSFTLSGYNSPIIAIAKSNISFGLNSQKPPFEDTLQTHFRFKPSPIQVDSAKAIYEDKDAFVTFPTGSGKTLVAEYTIAKNLDEGKKTYYTTPLKALSNQKYFDFCKQYGEDNVGIATGDIKKNVDAPIVVMTTEIYRNAVASGQEEELTRNLKDVNSVIFDEFHYMNDPDRGTVWEESVMYTPKNVQIVPLSATVGNADKLTNWIGAVKGSQISLIQGSEDERYVPLIYNIYKDGKLKEMHHNHINIENLKEDISKNKLSERRTEVLTQLAKAFYGSENVEHGLKVLNRTNNSADALTSILIESKKFKKEEAIAIATILSDKDEKLVNNKIFQGSTKKSDKTVQDIHFNLITQLKDKQMLPAIDFVFSKRKCDDLANYFVKKNKSLLSNEEEKEINKILDNFEKQNKYLPKQYNREMLTRGVAVHHAGLLPMQKDLIEKLFQKKLIKAVFATETLAAGINMPARTTIISALDKPVGAVDGKVTSRPLLNMEFKQMAGRAGRRGIDNIGNVIVLAEEEEDLERAVDIASSTSEGIDSKFNPSYLLIASNIKNKRSFAEFDKLLEKSFKVHSEPKETRGEVLKNLKTETAVYRKILVDKGFIQFDATQKPVLTKKGELLTKVRGTNEVLMAEFLASDEITRLTADELAGAVSTLITGINSKDFGTIHPELKDKFTAINQEMDTLKNQLKDLIPTIQLQDKHEQFGENSNLAEKLKARLDEINEEYPDLATEVIRAREKLKNSTKIDRKFLGIDKETYLSPKQIVDTLEAHKQKTIESLKNYLGDDYEAIFDNLIAQHVSLQQEYAHKENRYAKLDKIEKRVERLQAQFDKIALTAKVKITGDNLDELYGNAFDKIPGELCEDFAEVYTELSDQIIKRDELLGLKEKIKEVRQQMEPVEKEFEELEQVQQQLDMAKSSAKNDSQKKDFDILNSLYSEVNSINKAFMLISNINGLKKSRGAIQRKSELIINDSTGTTDYANAVEFLKQNAKSLHHIQVNAGISEEKAEVPVDAVIGKYIKHWAMASKDNSYEEWEKVTEELRLKTEITYEGKFYQTVNQTIDMLNQVKSMAEYMVKTDTDKVSIQKYESLMQKAEEAVEMLKKPPTDNVLEDLNIG